MGILDEMAAAQREQVEKPHGWKTTQEFADQMGVSWARAKRILKGLENRGELVSRKWTNPADGKTSTIYGEPV